MIFVLIIFGENDALIVPYFSMDFYSVYFRHMLGCLVPRSNENLLHKRFDQTLIVIVAQSHRMYFWCRMKFELHKNSIICCSSVKSR